MFEQNEQLPTEPRVTAVPAAQTSGRDVPPKFAEMPRVRSQSHCSIHSAAAVSTPDPSTISYSSIPRSCEWDRSKDYSSEKELQNCILRLLPPSQPLCQGWLRNERLQRGASLSSGKESSKNYFLN